MRLTLPGKRTIPTIRFKCSAAKNALISEMDRNAQIIYYTAIRGLPGTDIIFALNCVRENLNLPLISQSVPWIKLLFRKVK